MTYKRLYNELVHHTSRNGSDIIDKLVLTYGQVATVDAIAYIADFWKSSMMLNMTYWHSGEKTNEYLATVEIMRTLGDIYPVYRTECEYYCSL